VHEVYSRGGPVSAPEETGDFRQIIRLYQRVGIQAEETSRLGGSPVEAGERRVHPHAPGQSDPSGANGHFPSRRRGIEDREAKAAAEDLLH